MIYLDHVFVKNLRESTPTPEESSISLVARYLEELKSSRGKGNTASWCQDGE